MDWICYAKWSSLSVEVVSFKFENYSDIFHWTWPNHGIFLTLSHRKCYQSLSIIDPSDVFVCFCFWMSFSIGLMVCWFSTLIFSITKICFDFRIETRFLSSLFRWIIDGFKFNTRCSCNCCHHHYIADLEFATIEIFSFSISIVKYLPIDSVCVSCYIEKLLVFQLKIIKMSF